jgi:hypothetical protein
MRHEPKQKRNRKEVTFLKKHNKRTPDVLHHLKSIIKELTKEELYEFYMKQGYSDEDAMMLSGIVAESDEDIEAE